MVESGICVGGLGACMGFFGGGEGESGKDVELG